MLEQESEIVAAPHKRRRSTHQIHELLAMYAGSGRSLSEMPALLGRSISTLKRYARERDVRFPDYQPRARREQ